MKSDKKKLEKYTLGYFNNSSELKEKYSFSWLSYYPVFVTADRYYLIDNNYDSFVLWDNLIESYRFFNIEISQESFPLTFSFLKKSIFLPAKFFKDPGSKELSFHCCLD
jgi:hypothetical protein